MSVCVCKSCLVELVILLLVADFNRIGLISGPATVAPLQASSQSNANAEAARILRCNSPMDTALDATKTADGNRRRCGNTMDWMALKGHRQ